MKNLKIIHTADVHFGIENYGFLDPKTGLHTRLLDFKKSFQFIVNKAIEENVDCFIFAGDAYKNSHPTPTHQKILLECIIPLLDKKIPVVIIVGNHDHSGNSSKAHALDVFNHMRVEGCYVFSKPEKISIKTKSGILQIIGIPWPNRSIVFNDKNINFGSDVSEIVGNSLRKIIKDYSLKIDKNEAAVLVGHLTISTGSFSGSERSVLIGRDPVLLPVDVLQEGIDYVALGHLHKHQNLNKNGSCPIVYSGSPEKIDFGEVNDEKGFCLIEIEVHENKKETKYQFIKTPTRPFLEIYLKCNSLETMEDDFKECIKNLDLRESIIKIFYTVSSDVSRLPSMQLFQRIFKNVWYIAGIQCLNTPKNYREKTFKIKKSSTIYEMVENFCLNKKEDSETIKKYLEIIRDCEEKYEI